MISNGGNGGGGKGAGIRRGALFLGKEGLTVIVQRTSLTPLHLEKKKKKTGEEKKRGVVTQTHPNSCLSIGGVNFLSIYDA